MERVAPRKSSPSITCAEENVNEETDNPIKSSNLNGTVDKHEEFIHRIHDLRSITGSFYDDMNSSLDIKNGNQTSQPNKNFGGTFETSQILQSTPTTKIFKNMELQINSLSKVSYNLIRFLSSLSACWTSGLVFFR